MNERRLMQQLELRLDADAGVVGDDAPYRLPAPRIAPKAPHAGHEAFLHLPTRGFATHEPAM